MNTKNRNQFLIEHIIKICVVFTLLIAMVLNNFDTNSSYRYEDFTFIMAIIFFIVLIVFAIIKFFNKWNNIKLKEMTEYKFLDKVYFVLLAIFLVMSVGIIPNYFGLTNNFVTTLIYGFFMIGYFIEFYIKYKFGKSNNFQ